MESEKMEGEKTTELLLKQCSNTIISGTVFTIFSILLPFGLWVYLCGNAFQPPILSFSLNIIKNLNTPFLFISIVFGIGLVLDLLEPWKLLNQFPFLFFKKTWIGLKVSIVKSFDIEIDNDPDKNMANIKEIANLIHKKFVKTNYPDTDTRIEVNRFYHETLYTSFFSILFGIILSIAITIVYTRLEQLPLLIALMFLLVVIYWVGKRKVSHELWETNKFTEALLRKIFLEHPIDCHRFVAELIEKEGLVIEDDHCKWKVKKQR